MSAALLHPINLWGNLDLSPFLGCLTASFAMLGCGALAPAMLWPRRSPILGTGALFGRSVLGYLGTTCLGTAIFFGALGLSEYFDEHAGERLSGVFGMIAYAMLVIGPLLVASSFGYDVALALRARRAHGTTGPLLLVLLAGLGLVLHALLAAIFALGALGPMS